ncbi:protein angel homolog 2 isoform X2 [Lepisosteus oculatus]
MFAHHLKLPGRSHFFHLRAFRSSWEGPALWNSSCLSGLPPWPQQFHPSRYLSVNFKPPYHFHHSRWRTAWPNSSFTRFRQAPAIYLSCGHMDRCDNGPPFKRRKSNDETRQHGARGSPSLRSVRPPGSPNDSSQNSPAESETTCVSQTCPHQAKRGAEIQRRWEDFSQHYQQNEGANIFTADGKETKSFDFSVMSYNILSQDLLEDNSHLYRHCSQPILNWNHRFPNILKEFKQHNADILCLQEVQEDHYKKQIKPSLESLGYHCEYKMRTGRKPDGCVIGFKQSKFSLVSCHPVEFYRHGIPLLDRDNVGLVLLLRPAAPGCSAPCLCVANTHLLYNPRRGDIKLTQLAMLLAEISKVSDQEDGSYCPIIFCGDFNSVPGSPLYSFIREGKLEYEGLPIGKISGQEQNPRGQRILSVPIWPKSLGISNYCQYEMSPEAKPVLDEGGISGLCVREEENFTPEKKLQSSIEHKFRLTSVYSHFLTKGGTPEITTCHSRTALTVDYVFYSAAKNDISVQPGSGPIPDGRLQLLARLCLLCEKDLWTINGLPNEHNSSDHLPLLARFRLRC